MRLALTIFILSFLQIIALCQTGKMMRLLKKGKFQEAIDYTIEKVDKTKNPIRYHQGLARAYALIGNDIRAEKEFKKALIHVDKKSKKEIRLRDFDVMDELAL